MKTTHITDISSTNVNIALKAIKVFEANSDETQCYQANVYVDNKPFYIVSNSGNGGCDNVYQHPKCKLTRTEWRAKGDEIKKALSTIRTAPSEYFTDGMELDLELLCHEYVTDFLLRRDFKRRLATKKTLIIEKGIMYALRNKWSNTASFINGVKAHYKGCTILNELSFEEAFVLYVNHG